MFEKLLCEHQWVLRHWDEKVVPKEVECSICKGTIKDVSRKCEFYFQCYKCGTRKNIRSDVGFDLIKSGHK